MKRSLWRDATSRSSHSLLGEISIRSSISQLRTTRKIASSLIHSTEPNPRRTNGQRHLSFFTRQMATEEEQEPELIFASEEARKAKEAQERKKDLEEAYHPLRLELANEIHARSSLNITLPLKASFLVYHTGDDEQSFSDCVQHLCALCHRYNVSPPSLSKHVTDDGGEGVLLSSPGEFRKVSHYLENFGPFILKWERHGEFTTFTFIRQGDYDLDKPFDDPPIAWVPATWRRQIPGKLLVALNCAFETSQAALSQGRIRHDVYSTSAVQMSKLSSLFDGNRVVGGMVFNNLAEVFSDFHVHEDGFGRVLIRDIGAGLTLDQAGKLLQNILDIETYRILALMGLPLAKGLTPLIRRVHQDLYLVTSTLNTIKTQADEKNLLYRLFDLSTEVDRMVSTSLYRLDATMAYYAIANTRLRELYENPTTTGPPPIAGFLSRRMGPAIDTCTLVQRRIDRLRQAINGPAELLQASINLEVEKQNQQILASMDRRSKLQLRLQQTVEGLSVVAISYYTIGIVAYVTQAASAAELLGGLSTEMATGIAIPFVVGSVWALLRRAKNKVLALDTQLEAPKEEADSKKQETEKTEKAEGASKTSEGGLI